MGHLVTQFQWQILRAAANNRVCGHASTCVHAPTSPTEEEGLYVYLGFIVSFGGGDPRKK